MRGSLSCPWGNGNVIKPCVKSYMIINPGAKIPIPRCPEDTDPLHLFEETHVDRNLYRWVVFVVWLKAHPLSRNNG